MHTRTNTHAHAHAQAHTHTHTHTHTHHTHYQYKGYPVYLPFFSGVGPLRRSPFYTDHGHECISWSIYVFVPSSLATFYAIPNCSIIILNLALLSLFFLQVWDLCEGRLFYTIHGHECISWSSYVLVSSSKFRFALSLRFLQVWDLCEGRLFYTIHGHESAANACAFAPDGDFFATAAADHQVSDYNLVHQKICICIYI